MLILPAHLDHVQAISHKSSASNNAGSWASQASAANWRIDASQLTKFDSSALALLLDFWRAALAANAQLKIYRLPKGLAQLATLYGVDELLMS